MTLRWLPLDALEPHPENANRMPEALLEKLQLHIERTGRYEPLVVRPVPSPVTRGRVRKSQRYQILNGHHRARVLRELGWKRARCDVWDVDDDEARMLLATLNRLEGRDDPKSRARLVAHLATGRSAEDLARLLPEPPDAVERLLRLAEPPPEPASPDSLEPLPQALVFFLSEEQEAVVREALRSVGERSGEALAGKPPVPPGERAPGASEQSFEPPAEAGGHVPSRGLCQGGERRRGLPPAAHDAVRGDGKRLGRAERLERLALWYLESVGRR